MSNDVRHDTQARRFVLSTESGEEAYLAYRVRDPGTLDLASTFTPPSARGHGLAGRLVEAALDYAQANGLRVIPTCSYVHAWIERHPDRADLLA